MENQHKHIKGYRDLSKEEIEMMNEGKALAESVGHFINRLKSTNGIDQRWVSIAQTQLQVGFMALTRSIAQPLTF